MYFPILRGRQFELLALRELLNKGVLSNQVIPIIEPVKVSTTFVKTIETFTKKNRNLVVIRNPKVGSWNKEIEKDINSSIKTFMENIGNNTNVIFAYYLDENIKYNIEKDDKKVQDIILICDSQNYLNTYETYFHDKTPLYNLVPDRRDFRRKIEKNLVICEDHFNKKNRNVDYYDIKTEFFSSDHKYYKKDGYEGFSDFSIIGKDYNETGFAPYAVAIHILYFDSEEDLQVAHFVSETNDDITNPAGKFAEAVQKLVSWNKEQKLDTIGMKAFEKDYQTKNYPGLGVIKKYSLMHHLELISNLLDGEKK